jgi:hypothetical protein
MKGFGDGEQCSNRTNIRNATAITSRASAAGKVFELCFAPSERVAGELTPELRGEYKQVGDTGTVEATFTYCPEKHTSVPRTRRTHELLALKGTPKVTTKGKKFYEAAAVGSTLAAVGATASGTISKCLGKHQRIPVCRAVLRYDTAENLFLRRLLDPSNPAHAPHIPPEQEYCDLVKEESALGARPASEALTEHTCDLTGDEEVWTSVQKRPKVEDLG